MPTRRSSATPGRLGLAPRSFDVVLYRLVLHHIAYKEPLAPCFVEAASLLKPGGALVVIEPGLWHPVGGALAVANRVGLGSHVHGTPDDVPLSPRRLLDEARAAGLDPELHTVTYAWRRLSPAVQRAAGALDRPLGSRTVSARFGHTLMLIARNRWGSVSGLMRRQGPPLASAAVSSVVTAAPGSGPADASTADRATTWSRRPSPDVLTALLLAAAIVALAMISGGGVDNLVATPGNTWTEIAVTVLGATTVGVVVVIGPPGRRWGSVTILLMATLTILEGLSITWSYLPDSSWLATSQAVSFLAAFAAAVCLAWVAPHRWPALLGGFAIAMTALCGWSLLVKVFPSTLASSATPGRLEAPFGYWNAIGLCAALGLPACLWGGARRDARAAGGRSRRTGAVSAAQRRRAVLLALGRRGRRRRGRAVADLRAATAALGPDAGDRRDRRDGDQRLDADPRGPQEWFGHALRPRTTLVTRSGS